MALKDVGFLILVVGVLLACDSQKSEQEPEKEYHGLNREYMDTTISPKEDFYHFVNGNWMNSVEIPADRGRWGSFDELRIQTSERTLAVLEKSMKDEADPDSDQGKASAFYGVAMDTAALNEIGLYPIQEYLDAIKNITNQNELNRYLSEFFRVNGSPYFSFYVRAGMNVSDTNSLFLGPGALGLPEREYYMNDDSASLDIQAKYRTLLVEAIELLEIGDGKAEELAEAIYRLEKEMASTRLTKEKRRNATLLNNPRTISQVDRLMPFVGIDSFLSELGIEKIDTIVVTQPEYIRSLDRLMKNHSLETHKAYLAWMVLHSYGDHLDTETEKMMFSFYGKELEGTEVMKPRWERVLDNANNVIGEAIGHLYVDEYFPPEAKEEAVLLVENIRKAFAERIKNLDWMTDATKEKALEKLSTFTVKIGYPDKWKDYSGLVIQPIEKGGSYAGNIRNIREWNWREDLKELGKAVDKSEWFMAPQIVNAYYNPSYNEIVFPAAILQPPFFDFKADPGVNYGGIGAVIGHEISHGFDDQGSRYDADGNLKNWWSKEDETAFNDRKKKLVDQYNHYQPFPDLSVNGEFTLGENIGDLGGVNVAYDALQMHLESDDPGEVDGFTQSQRFFINWATIWRTKMRDEALRKQIKTDPHSPGMYRAIGPISNMDAFYEAFEIGPGDPLFVPADDRIKIW